jgi:hypothetical protein
MIKKGFTRVFREDEEGFDLVVPNKRVKLVEKQIIGLNMLEYDVDVDKCLMWLRAILEFKYSNYNKTWKCSIVNKLQNMNEDFNTDVEFYDKIGSRDDVANYLANLEKRLLDEEDTVTGFDFYGNGYSVNINFDMLETEIKIRACFVLGSEYMLWHSYFLHSNFMLMGVDQITKKYIHYVDGKLQPTLALEMISNYHHQLMLPGILGVKSMNNNYLSLLMNSLLVEVWKYKIEFDVYRLSENHK